MAEIGVDIGPICADVGSHVAEFGRSCLEVCRIRGPSSATIDPNSADLQSRSVVDRHRSQFCRASAQNRSTSGWHWSTLAGAGSNLAEFRTTRRNLAEFGPFRSNLTQLRWNSANIAPNLANLPALAPDSAPNISRTRPSFGHVWPNLAEGIPNSVDFGRACPEIGKISAERPVLAIRPSARLSAVRHKEISEQGCETVHRHFQIASAPHCLLVHDDRLGAPMELPHAARRVSVPRRTVGGRCFPISPTLPRKADGHPLCIAHLLPSFSRSGTLELRLQCARCRPLHWPCVLAGLCPVYVQDRPRAKARLAGNTFRCRPSQALRCGCLDRIAHKASGCVSGRRCPIGLVRLLLRSVARRRMKIATHLPGWGQMTVA